MAYPDFSLPFILYTDASTSAIGHCLAQVDHNGNERPIGYAGRSLNVHERNYSITHLELLAAVHGVTYWKSYLEGSKFTLVTDHKALTSILTTKQTVPKLIRWALVLQSYDFDVQYRKGKLNCAADALSRRDYDTSHCTNDDVIDAYPDLALISDTQANVCPVSTRSRSQVQTSSPATADAPPRRAATSLNHNVPNSASTLSDTIKRLLKQAAVDLNPKTIRQAQGKCDFCVGLLDWLEQKKLPTTSKAARKVLLRENDYVVDNGILYHLFRPVASKPGEFSLTLVVPESLRHTVLSQCHDSALAGHVGINKMLTALKQRFSWPGMYKDVREYIDSCPHCIATKRSHRRERPTMTLFEPVTAPWQRISMDNVGPLPRTPAGYQYITVVIDHYSRYVVSWPSRNLEASTLAKNFYEKVICVHGMPLELLTDKGSHFTSKLFKELNVLFKGT